MPEREATEIPQDLPEAEPSAEQTPPENSSPEEPSPESGEAAAAAPPEILDTTPVSSTSAHAMGQVPVEGQLLEACPACGTLMDVTDHEPFSKIHCPSCGQALRARKHFNHYRLLELVGEGGMGQVFKATDCNLNRLVALKVLKKELASSPEERAKLAEEARITATVTHPHVVKVFSFGEDHGQFYMAMELVEKGSLDDLLGIQKRVPEIQVLNVGIQIAEGLQAALEVGLIHRDIKPGNILFSDPHTAKLVDFGLAIVMDQAAAAIGEIWGTPYYIAPEKLDNLPEDFRSDIYSLGGTLFHGLAGRPPYEAETASMVALKQLKSQQVSLQSFAPDVTSETAYVINRMIAKNPDERYNSYDELIEHLGFAKAKLLERIKNPPKPKERVMLETEQTRKFSGMLSLGLLLAVLIVAGVGVFVLRDRIFPQKGSSAGFVVSDFDASLKDAVAAAAEGRFDEAISGFSRLAAEAGTPQPQLDWARMNLGVAQSLAGNGEDASKTFAEIKKTGLYSSEGEEGNMATFFVESAAKLANTDSPVDTRFAYLYSSTTYESFGLFAFAVHNWMAGDLPKSGPIFKRFVRASPPAPYEWIAGYVPLAKRFAADYEILNALEKKASAAKDPGSKAAVLREAEAAREKLVTGSAATDKLDTIIAGLK